MGWDGKEALLSEADVRKGSLLMLRYGVFSVREHTCERTPA